MCFFWAKWLQDWWDKNFYLQIQVKILGENETERKKGREANRKKGSVESNIKSSSVEFGVWSGLGK